MIRIGRLADYGVVILHHLGRVRPARLSVDSLAELTHLPLPTVRKVTRCLADAGLVVSKRGPKGGYQIARAPAAISLAEAITAIEGPIALTDCCAEDGACEIADRCDLAGGWPGINTILMRVLARTSLADLDGFGRSDRPVPPPLRDLLAVPLR
ncbi:MAG: SUF system Fe-S cluster assembly regulator [Pseudomonadales bacterium]|jgi:FeS assembly SUF system regulator|nr:SUF system Fe-S cluster assembly regulator [Pseudomonadales bacterium]